MNKYIFKTLFCLIAALSLSVSVYATDSDVTSSVPDTTIAVSETTTMPVETTKLVEETTTASETTAPTVDESTTNVIVETTSPEEVIVLTSPKVTSLKNVYGGVEVKWEKRDGAESYKVYRKTKGTKWAEIKTVKENSFVDKKVKSGEKYTYTVRCADANGNAVSPQISGKSCKYIKTPVIRKISNLEKTAEIKWSEVKGVTKYSVYYINSKNKWKKLATTDKTTYTHKKVADGKTYTYKVKGLDKKGNVITGEKEKTNLFVSPLTLKKVSKAKKGIKIQWETVKNAYGYRLYRKTFGGKWKKIADIKNAKSYIDTKASADKIYAYTVRLLNEKGKTISYYNDDVIYYKNGKPANGTVSVKKDTYKLKDGIINSSLITDGRYKYYYGKDGKLQKNGIVGSKETNYWYADKKGRIDTNYVNGLTIDGKKWIIRNGQALPVKTKHHGVLYRAAIEVTKATNTSMTKEQKLKACFDYVKSAYVERNPRVPHYLGDDWPIIYADDMFINGVGNCCSYGSAFAHMAYVMGYENVYCCNSGGHGWAEIEGLIYDPEWSRHRFKYSYYALSYDTKTDQNYKGAIAAGKSWMHVKIEY